MMIPFYLMVSLDLSDAFILPNYFNPNFYNSYGNYFPFNAGVPSQINVVDYRALANQQGLQNHIYQNQNVETGMKGYDLKESYKKNNVENAGNYNSDQNEKESGKHYDNQNYDEQKELNENENKRANKKLYKGFHDVYKRNEHISKNQYWDNYDVTGNYFKSGMNMEEGDQSSGNNMEPGLGEISNTKTDSFLNGMNIDGTINNDDWNEGYIMSWKMKLAPNGTYVKYAEDMKEGKFFPPWAFSYF